MTEEDTFRHLCRLPKSEMIKLMIGFAYVNMDLPYDEWIVAKVDFLKEHGWTLYEFHKATDK